MKVRISFHLSNFIFYYLLESKEQPPSDLSRNLLNSRPSYF